MKKLSLILFLFCTIPLMHSQSWNYNYNRIAVSSDGNSAPDNEYKWPIGDPDDWGANAAMLAVLGKLKMQSQLVHFSYNNFIDAPAGPDNENQNKISCDGGIERWHFDASKFFDVTTNLEDAKLHLAEEMAKSTANDPLYFIHAGLSEFLYLTVEKVIELGGKEALSHVYLISHSGFNEGEKRREWHHTWTDVQELCGNRINYKKIVDQNACDNSSQLWCSNSDFSVWHWMRDHNDENIQWLYSRVEAHESGKADISDVGMLYWLLFEDEYGNSEKLETLIGDGIPEETVINVSGIAADTDELLVYQNQSNTITASVLPREAWNKNIIWSSINESIATVKNGRVYGVNVGETQVVATSGDGAFTDTVDITVKTLTACNESYKYNALTDFETLTVDGFSPAYKDNSRNAMAIDASLYKGVFAAVQTTFKEETGLYDINFKSLTETDGECTYRLLIDGHLVGEFQNPESTTDYTENIHTFPMVTIPKGAQVQIEFNSHSNGKIPEGDAYAFARGRWREIEFSCTKTDCEITEANGMLIIEGESFDIKGQWEIKEDELAKGGKYIQFVGPNLYNAANSANNIEVKFNIINPGSYTVKWLMRQPTEAEGDKSNDAWIDFPDAIQMGGEETLTGFHKFVGRNKDVFGFNGQLDLHDSQPWMNVKFETAGTYTLLISGRSELLQIDRFVIFKGLTATDAESNASTMDETTNCNTIIVDPTEGFSTYKELISHKITQNIVVDGIKDNTWNVSEYEQGAFEAFGKELPAISDHSYQFKTAYDDDAFYFWIEVMDDNKQKYTGTNNQHWDSDNVELFFNADDVHEATGEFTDDVSQIRFNYGYSDLFTGQGKWLGESFENMTYVSIDTDNGYNIEARIPWEAILGDAFTISDQQKLGFEVNIGESDEAGIRSNQLAWANDTQRDVASRDTRVYGHLILDNSTSIKSSRENTLKIYPNPVQNNFSVLGLNDKAACKIYNSCGQEVVEQDINSIKNEVSCTTLEQGIYFVHIESQSGVDDIKFLKK